jgi:hypothetical protein
MPKCNSHDVTPEAATPTTNPVEEELVRCRECDRMSTKDEAKQTIYPGIWVGLGQFACVWLVAGGLFAGLRWFDPAIDPEIRSLVLGLGGIFSFDVVRCQFWAWINDGTWWCKYCESREKSRIELLSSDPRY